MVKGIRMPSAAPGVIARGAMRQPGPRCSWVPIPHSNRTGAGCSSGVGSGSDHPPGVRRHRSYLCFTQLLSVIGVERGRLGEVVSLVGDCRPPPPGNPHRPLGLWRWPNASWRPNGGVSVWGIGRQSSVGIAINMQPPGGNNLPIRLGISFNNKRILTNLKDLKSSEYFKVNRSYITCAGIWPVLKFDNFHSHLCGFIGVEPPSIAITNVLEM